MIFGLSLKDCIDILLVAILMYQTYKLMKGTGAVNIFIGIIGFIVAWFLVSYVFKMTLLGAILDRVVGVGAIALIVIFQQEIRRFLLRLGTGKNWRLWQKIKEKFTPKDQQEKLPVPILPIIIACQNMARTKTGALIIITRKNSLQEYFESGEIIDAKINTPLIETIFFKNTPLHDGAMIICNDRIAAAGCILPLSENLSIPKQLGLRHHAAIGVTEQTDAIAIVVSEETGNISIANNGHWHTDLSAEQIKKVLTSKLKDN